MDKYKTSVFLANKGCMYSRILSFDNLFYILYPSNYVYYHLYKTRLKRNDYFPKRSLLSRDHIGVFQREGEYLGAPTLWKSQTT